MGRLQKAVSLYSQIPPTAKQHRPSVLLFMKVRGICTLDVYFFEQRSVGKQDHPEWNQLGDADRECWKSISIDICVFFSFIFNVKPLLHIFSKGYSPLLM